MNMRLAVPLVLTLVMMLGFAPPATGQQDGLDSAYLARINEAIRRQDVQAAVKLLEEGVGQGRAGAMIVLGGLYANGEAGLPKDGARAAELYRRAFDTGFERAGVQLGRLYLYGAGVPRDSAAAARLFQRAAAAAAQDPHAQYEYGRVLVAGRHIAGDYNEGIRRLILASDNGANFAGHELSFIAIAQRAAGECALRMAKELGYREFLNPDDGSVAEAAMLLNYNTVRSSGRASFLRVHEGAGDGARGDLIHIRFATTLDYSGSRRFYEDNFRPLTIEVKGFRGLWVEYETVENFRFSRERVRREQGAGAEGLQQAERILQRCRAPYATTTAGGTQPQGPAPTTPTSASTIRLNDSDRHKFAHYRAAHAECAFSSAGGVLRIRGEIDRTCLGPLEAYSTADVRLEAVFRFPDPAVHSVANINFDWTMESSGSTLIAQLNSEGVLRVIDYTDGQPINRMYSGTVPDFHAAGRHEVTVELRGDEIAVIVNGREHARFRHTRPRARNAVIGGVGSIDFIRFRQTPLADAPAR
jgi:TPR repeat protein